MKSVPWQILLDWFKKNGRHDFPWRQYSQKKDNCYKIWLAEILLQQTQADRVITFYLKILEKYPTIQDLAKTSYEEFFPFYQGLGYYSRARNLLKTAKIVNEEYQGIFPADKVLLKKLPGIGEYTARAILAFGYKKPILAWDTNLETIFSRYYKGNKNIKLTVEEKDEIEKDFEDFIANKKNREQQMGIREGDTVGAMKKSGKNTNIENDVLMENITRDVNNALMDWARISEPKNASLLDYESYIFTESEFYITRGKNEIIEKKKTSYFPIPDAKIIVIIHQDHKIYYSLSGDSYTPFEIPPSGDRITRKYVQDYFREKYGIELSVRPIHKKWITELGVPYISVNAQIQMGAIPFIKWNKKGEKIL